MKNKATLQNEQIRSFEGDSTVFFTFLKIYSLTFVSSIFLQVLVFFSFKVVWLTYDFALNQLRTGNELIPP